ncbi:MAG TPA: hypothetical protein VI759_02430 [Dehalococcoidia bacterium]|nr:hypothetical protein [Dehalococcoidia bacterium]
MTSTSSVDFDYIYPIRIGGLALIAKELSPSESTRLSEEDSKRADALGAQVLSLISKSPIVTQEPVGTLTSAKFSRRYYDINDFVGQVSPAFPGAISFKAHWPRKNQEFWREYDGDCIEDFEITYDGYLYSVTARCNAKLDRRYDFTFGREGRRILTSILGSSPQFSLEVVGPSPIHPLLYVIFAETPSDESHVDRDMESAIYLKKVSNEEERDIVSNIIRSLHMPISQFYSFQTSRSQFLNLRVALTEEFTSAATSYQRNLVWPGLSLTSWISTFNSRRELRKIIAQGYRHYADLEEMRIEAGQRNRRTVDLFANSPLLAPHQKYVDDRDLNDIQGWNPSHLMEAFGFLAEETRSTGIQQVTILAALVGAGVGGLIGSLVGFL